MPSVLFWDIDGTLLTTNRAGIFAWEDAVRHVLGGNFDFSALKTSGLTDGEIAGKILQSRGVEVTSQRLSGLLEFYESRLAKSLHRKTGSVLKNVREILEFLRPKADVFSYLLTGNTKRGAAAKLNHYRLDGFFREGSFCEVDHCVKRPDIARRALALARQTLGELDSNRVYVIGDTPHDVSCGKSIDARTIAVATSVYTVEELAACDPWRTWESLPSAEEFAACLNL